MTTHANGSTVDRDRTPATLYHYQEFNEEYLRATVVDNRIWFSDPKNFNDPWDCTPHMKRELLDGDATSSMYFDYMYELVRPKCQSDDEARKRAQYFLQTPERRQTLLKLGSDALVASHDKTRVYCLSSRRDSALMWSHYARNHSGICLGFRFASSEIFRRAIAVEYSIAYPVIDPIGLPPEELARRILCVKASDWAYEHEFRILASEKGATPGVLPVEDGFLRIDKSDLLVVIVGCRMKGEAEAKVRRLVALRPNPIPIVRARKAPDRYELEFDGESET